MVNIKKSLAITASTLLMICGAALPAGTAAADSSCPSGAACVWKDAGYYGGKFTFYRYVPNFRHWSFSDGSEVNDAISSAWNSGNYEGVCLFEHASGGGRSVRMGLKSGVSEMRYVNLNDQVSSGYFTGFRSC